MIRRFFLILALCIIVIHPAFIYAENHNEVEIFDPELNKVVKTLPLNKDINNMIEGWINDIEEVHPSMDPMTDDGYAIRFPLDPAVEVENQWLDTVIEEVYLIIPEKKQASFIAFDPSGSPVFFLFPGQIDELSKVLDFQLE